LSCDQKLTIGILTALMFPWTRHAVCKKPTPSITPSVYISICENHIRQMIQGRDAPACIGQFQDYPVNEPVLVLGASIRQ
jgi:hypothetical protein